MSVDSKYDPRYVQTPRVIDLRLEIENRIEKIDELIDRIKSDYGLGISSNSD